MKSTMKTKKYRTPRRRHELLREFFACAVVIAAIKSGQLNSTAVPGTKTPGTPSPSGRT